MSIVIKKFYEIVSRNMEGNRNEEQEKGAEIRAILSFRDRSFNLLEEEINITTAIPKWVKAVKGNNDGTKDSKWIGICLGSGLYMEVI